MRKTIPPLPFTIQLHAGQVRCVYENIDWTSIGWLIARGKMFVHHNESKSEFTYSDRRLEECPSQPSFRRPNPNAVLSITIPASPRQRRAYRPRFAEE